MYGYHNGQTLSVVARRPTAMPRGGAPQDLRSAARDIMTGFIGQKSDAEHFVRLCALLRKNVHLCATLAKFGHCCATLSDFVHSRALLIDFVRLCVRRL